MLRLVLPSCAAEMPPTHSSLVSNTRRLTRFNRRAEYSFRDGISSNTQCPFNGASTIYHFRRRTRSIAQQTLALLPPYLPPSTYQDILQPVKSRSSHLISSCFIAPPLISSNPPSPISSRRFSSQEPKKGTRHPPPLHPISNHPPKIHHALTQRSQAQPS